MSNTAGQKNGERGKKKTTKPHKHTKGNVKGLAIPG